MFLGVRSHSAAAQVIGIIREHLTPTAFFVTPGTFGRLTGTAGPTTGLRLMADRADETTVFALFAAIEKSLDAPGIRTSIAISRAALGRALGGHLFILIFVLVVMAILMAVVGVLGLASAMATSVMERTRENAVMRAIGTRRRAIRLGIVAEGLLIALLSTGVAFVLSVPMTAAMAWIVGTASLGLTIGVVASHSALLIWPPLALVAWAAASAVSAWKASSLTIREALSTQ